MKEKIKKIFGKVKDFTVKNAMWIVGVLFVVWITFFDDFSLIDRFEKMSKLHELRENFGQTRELVFETDNASMLNEEQFRNGLKLSESDLVIERKKNSFKVRFNSTKIPVGEMLSHTLSLTRVKDISVKDADIEEIIRNLYRKGETSDE